MGKNFITLSQFDSLAAVASAAIKEVADSMSSDSSVTKSGLQFAIGDTQPDENVILWFDTSDYASIQGATPTQSIFLNNLENTFVIGNTKPEGTNILWLDTSN